VFYHPHVYAVGVRDVIAAWLVCLAVAATGFAYAAVYAAPQYPAAAARILPHTPAATSRSAICTVSRSNARFFSRSANKRRAPSVFIPS
jgi:hypothetical protein